MDKEQITNENVDIARWAFGAYQSYANKPASVEVLIYEDGNSIDFIFGQVNPCKFGDQCEGHACYCNHPKAYRKCLCSWYYGDEKLDKKCEFYEPNPYWQNGGGNFYEQRDKTLLYLKEKGLLEISVKKLTAETPSNYKNHHSIFEGEVVREN